jgi:hypothetical protein
MMELALIGQRMRTQRAEAIAGVIACCLPATGMVPVWIFIPTNRHGPASDVINHWKTSSFVLNRPPFAGIELPPRTTCPLGRKQRSWKSMRQYFKHTARIKRAD